ncbi:MAG: hypothetical protein ACP5XB_08275 [Isosphaeraceae bacterium]
MIHRVLLAGRRVPWPRTALVMPALVLVALAGCGADLEDLASRVLEPITGTEIGRPSLRIATCWGRSDRQEIERELDDRAEGTRSFRLIWIELPEGTPLSRLGAHLPPFDVFLGGPLADYERLARAGRLQPLEDDAQAYWQVARRSLIDRASPLGQGDERPALDDPRVSPLTLAWAAGVLESGAWQDGYAALVRDFGHSLHRPGWLAGGALASRLREPGWSLVASRAPGTPRDVPPDSRSIVYEEGAAIVRGARHEAAARRFLQYLASRSRIGGRSSGRSIDPDATDLLADLLGATLVDAQDELRATWKILDRSDSSVKAQALLWLNEPPPWPPASVEKLQNQGGDRAIALVHELAGQVAPDPALRFWLIQNWLKPRRLLDRALFSELSRAEDGRLVREPRFRAWLRGEWTAWARQRYRRVARLLVSGVARAAGGPPRSPSR